ncbi:hypothetical protein Ancab_017843 [Ancistrocladus abbreviatus]
MVNYPDLRLSLSLPPDDDLTLTLSLPLFGGNSDDRKRKMEEAKTMGYLDSADFSFSLKKIASFRNVLFPAEIEYNNWFGISTELKLFDNPFGHGSSSKKAQEASDSNSVVGRSVTHVTTDHNSNKSSSEVLERPEERNMRPPVQLNHEPWKIKKKLNKSDVNMLCRLLISKTVVHAYVLPELESQEKRDRVRTKGGLKVMVWDCDTETQHPLTLEYWKSSRSYVFKSGWSGFVKRRGLTVGDEIGMFWDRLNTRFSFAVLARANGA